MQIIHADLYGPVDPSIHDDKNFFLTIVDDYIHFTTIYLLRFKNETE